MPPLRADLDWSLSMVDSLAATEKILAFYGAAFKGAIFKIADGVSCL